MNFILNSKSNQLGAVVSLGIAAAACSGGEALTTDAQADANLQPAVLTCPSGENSEQTTLYNLHALRRELRGSGELRAASGIGGDDQGVRLVATWPPHLYPVNVIATRRRPKLRRGTT